MIKPMKLYTKCQVCDRESEVPQQQSFFGVAVFVPDGWWLVGQAAVHDHAEDEPCEHKDPPRFVICTVECVARWAELTAVTT